MYYFAYGSNMDWTQMQSRCPSSRFVSIGRLIDYQFGILRHSRLRDCGTANVYSNPGTVVWGILYDVDEPDLAVLDAFEDGYRRETLPVLTPTENNERFYALVYVATVELDVPRPNPEYKRLMVEGARYWGLPANYLNMLQAIETAADVGQSPVSSVARPRPGGK
ncbi:MAG: gamma-glutamylcyclotransferase family protein [Chloroflexota bacterium]